MINKGESGASFELCLRDQSRVLEAEMLREHREQVTCAGHLRGPCAETEAERQSGAILPSCSTASAEEISTPGAFYTF